MIYCFDLEGPLSPMDFAADAVKAVGKKIGRTDLFDLFGMISEYDDVLVLEGRKNYQAGDTLRLLAPLIRANMSDPEMIELSKTATLTPGGKELIEGLDREDVYVISTSYEQHAYTTTQRLGISKENVYCTKLNDYSDFPIFDELLEVFEKFKKEKNIESVVPKLDELFWSKLEPSYLSTVVMGGINKANAVREISEKRGIPISHFAAIGDSITDMEMLKLVNSEGGLAISFNGNEFSLKNANIAVSALSNAELLPLFKAKDPWAFIEESEPTETVRYDDLRNREDLSEVLAAQKKARRELRAQYGELN